MPEIKPFSLSDVYESVGDPLDSIVKMQGLVRGGVELQEIARQRAEREQTQSVLQRIGRGPNAMRAAGRDLIAIGNVSGGTALLGEARAQEAAKRQQAAEVRAAETHTQAIQAKKREAVAAAADIVQEATYWMLNGDGSERAKSEQAVRGRIKSGLDYLVNSKQLTKDQAQPLYNRPDLIQMEMNRAMTMKERLKAGDMVDPLQTQEFQGKGVDAASLRILLNLQRRIRAGESMTEADRDEYAAAAAKYEMPRTQIIDGVVHTITPKLPKRLRITDERWGELMQPAAATEPAPEAEPISLPTEEKPDYMPSPDGGVEIEAVTGAGRKKYSDAQAKAAGFANRMVNASQNMGEVRSDLAFDPADVIQHHLKGMGTIGNLAMDSDFQVYTTAAMDWIRAKLRRESGAVIAVEEAESEWRTYFPVPGDKPDTIKQKAASRRRVERSMAEESQGAFESMHPQSRGLGLYAPQTDQDYSNVPPGAYYLDPGDGRVYRKPGGDNG